MCVRARTFCGQRGQTRRENELPLIAPRAGPRPPHSSLLGQACGALGLMCAQCLGSGEGGGHTLHPWPGAVRAFQVFSMAESCAEVPFRHEGLSWSFGAVVFSGSQKTSCCSRRTSPTPGSRSSTSAWLRSWRKEPSSKACVGLHSTSVRDERTTALPGPDSSVRNGPLTRHSPAGGRWEDATGGSELGGNGRQKLKQPVAAWVFSIRSPKKSPKEKNST